MKLFKRARRFNTAENGAVTVDWVVLTAAIVGMGVAVMATVRSGTTSVANKISTGLGTVSITT